MQELGAELLGEALPLALRSLAAVAFTLVGAVAEVNALSTLSHGDLLLGAWGVYMGGIALYAGLFVFGAEVLDAVGGDAETAT